MLNTDWRTFTTIKTATETENSTRYNNWNGNKA